MQLFLSTYWPLRIYHPERTLRFQFGISNSKNHPRNQARLGKGPTVQSHFVKKEIQLLLPPHGLRQDAVTSATRPVVFLQYLVTLKHSHSALSLCVTYSNGSRNLANPWGWFAITLPLISAPTNLSLTARQANVLYFQTTCQRGHLSERSFVFSVGAIMLFIELVS